MELELPLPFVVNLDDADDPADAIDAILLGRFVAGTQPVARTLEVARVRADAIEPELVDDTRVEHCETPPRTGFYL